MLSYYCSQCYLPCTGACWMFSEACPCIIQVRLQGHSTPLCSVLILTSQKESFLPVTRVFDIFHHVQVLGHCATGIWDSINHKEYGLLENKQSIVAEVQGLGRPISHLKARNKNNFLCSSDLFYILVKKQDKQNKKQFTREAKVASAEAVSITFRSI